MGKYITFFVVIMNNNVCTLRNVKKIGIKITLKFIQKINTGGTFIVEKFKLSLCAYLKIL